MHLSLAQKTVVTGNHEHSVPIQKPATRTQTMVVTSRAKAHVAQPEYV